jgi:hypothetical protein
MYFWWYLGRQSMRILFKECKKILDVRILLLLAVFTVFYYLLFMRIIQYPAGGQSTNSEYDIPFAGELVEEFGGTLSLSEWSKLDDKASQLEDDLSAIIRQNEVLKDAGITNYEEMITLEEKLWEKDEEEWTEEETRVSDEINQMIFSRRESSKLFFELQYLDNLNTEYKERLTKDYISLLPSGMLFILQEDMRHMGTLLVICFLVLIIHYQIRERLRGVFPLYASTYTGRAIYRKQFLAGMVSCGIVGIVQFLVYLGIYVRKGLAVFWQCECWSAAENNYWCDRLSFGAYMGIYMVLTLLVTMGAATVAYIIGRAVVNYIAGIAVAIPLGGVIAYTVGSVLSRLFFIKETDIVAFDELLFVFVWLVFTGIMVLVRLKRDKKISI